MTYLIIIAVVLIIAIAITIFCFIFISPFTYPYLDFNFDVSGMRSPDVNDLVDKFIINNGFEVFEKHYQKVQSWKNICKKQIEKSWIKKYRKKQFLRIIDDQHMFRINLIRRQTRYQQKNYVRTPYTVYVNRESCSYSYGELEKRYHDLSQINFECSLSDYHVKNQRSKMTKALRDEIALRDNFTCQSCGKYMPDGVGLHIDHIIPISKGGKSIPSNLQVLCSKCNGHKSKK